MAKIAKQNGIRDIFDGFLHALAIMPPDSQLAAWEIIKLMPKKASVDYKTARVILETAEKLGYITRIPIKLNGSKRPKLVIQTLAPFEGVKKEILRRREQEAASLSRQVESLFREYEL